MSKREQQIRAIAQLPRARQRFVSEINGEQDTTGRFQRILCGTDARSGQRHRSADDRKQRRHPSWYTDLRGVQRQHH